MPPSPEPQKYRRIRGFLANSDPVAFFGESRLAGITLITKPERPLPPSAQLLGFGQEALEYSHEISSCGKTRHILSSCSRQQEGSIRSFACRALAAVMRAPEFKRAKVRG